MADRFKHLRAAGVAGNWLANILTFLGTNWGLTMSAAIGILAATWKGLFILLSSARLEIGVGAFLAALWTIIGICTLIDRRKPRMVQSHADYRYGLTLEGFIPNFLPENNPIPSMRGALGFSTQFRNFSPGPIKYTLESAEIQIGTRAPPKYKRNTVSGYMARGGGKQVRHEAFPAGSLSEFYGKGESKGTADISITYGPPDGPPLRRLKFSIEMTLFFPDRGIADPASGLALGYSDNVISEEDAPY